MTARTKAWGLGAVMMAAAMTNGGADAAPITFGTDKVSLRLGGYGTVGVIEPDFNKTDFVGDWRVRAQATYAPAASQTIGVVYALDAQTVDKDNYIDELFGFWQTRRLGRIEVGVADSIAGKLGLGLPDVGGLRVNDNPLFYKKIHPRGPVITDASVDTNATALRVNVATRQIGGVQYGLSVAGVTNKYDFALDAGVKIRRGAGKVKTAYSVGASFMDNPNGFCANPFGPDTTADWRGQVAMAMNLQYNSWVWGLNGRAVYDRDPVGVATDGFMLGTGVSYDLMQYSFSVTYMLSDTGVWHSDATSRTDHSVVASLRYKYSANVDGWTSIGWTTDTPFVAAGLRLTF